MNLFTAIAAGMLSFLSPCVLPLIPGYVSFISGISLPELQSGDLSGKTILKVFFNTLWFVLGFSAVFVALGASATAVGAVFLQKLDLLKKGAGILIVVFGLHLIGVFRLPFLEYEKKLHVSKAPLTAMGAFLVGAAFAFGWTPCIGPILAGILALASAQATIGRGMLLLAAYSAGLGIPFLATSVAVHAFSRFFAGFRRHMRIVEIVSGLLLVAIGIGIFTDRLAKFSQYFTFFNRFSL